MIKVTYFVVERFIPRFQAEGKWESHFDNDVYSSLAEAEAALAKEKNRWDNFLAEQNPQGEEASAHIARLKAESAFRVVEKEVGYKYACHYKYSDVDAYEIVKVVSDKTIEVRKMDSKHNIAHLKQYVGGFGGHVADQRDQKVTYASNPNNEVIRIRKKKNGGWGYKDCRFGLSEKPYAFYDFNF